MNRIYTIERIGPTKVKFIYPCGHSEIKDYGKGPVSKRIGPDGVSFLLKYWRNSGVYSNCAVCKRKEKSNV